MTATHCRKQRGRLFSVPGALIVFCAAAFLAWPMLLVSAPIVYFDTFGYVSSGEKAYSLLWDVLGLAPEAGGRGVSSAPTDEPRNMRSAAYSLYMAAMAFLPQGLVLATVFQAAVVLFMLGALLDGWRVPIALLGATFVFAGLVTTLPWMVSYAMPDILGAAIITYYAVISTRSGELSRGSLIFLCAIAAFATASHYGNLGLSAGLGLVLLICSVSLGRLTAPLFLLAFAPVAAAVVVNLMAGAFGMNDLSVVPKRIPILLARSVEDGPAAQYLDAVCPEAGYAICPYFPDMPRDVGGFLWSDQGVKRMSVAEFERLRDEELTILANAFLAHPWRQIIMFAINTGRQLLQIGTGQMYPVLRDAAPGHREGHPALTVFDLVTKIGTAVAAVALGVRLWQASLGCDGRLIITIFLAGLIGNAMIFGGLSVPVDRYNSRVIWLLVPLLLIVWQDSRGKRQLSLADGAGRVKTESGSGA